MKRCLALSCNRAFRLSVYGPFSGGWHSIAMLFRRGGLTESSERRAFTVEERTKRCTATWETKNDKRVREERAEVLFDFD